MKAIYETKPGKTDNETDQMMSGFTPKLRKKPTEHISAEWDPISMQWSLRMEDGDD